MKLLKALFYEVSWLGLLAIVLYGTDLLDWLLHPKTNWLMFQQGNPDYKYEVIFRFILLSLVIWVYIRHLKDDFGKP